MKRLSDECSGSLSFAFAVNVEFWQTTQYWNTDWTDFYDLLGTQYTYNIDFQYYVYYVPMCLISNNFVLFFMF